MSTLKTIRIEKAPNGLFYAKYDGGGQLPAYLGGVWTHENELRSRVDSYLSTRKPSTATQRTAAKKQTQKVKVDG